MREYTKRKRGWRAVLIPLSQEVSCLSGVCRQLASIVSSAKDERQVEARICDLLDGYLLHAH